MRKKVIAGNWKMYKNIQETTELINGLRASLAPLTEKVNVIIAPPFTSLTVAKGLIANTRIHLGAQNMYPETEGAYTGEISPKMLTSIGVEYVILGHSERRQYFKETDGFINTKARKALAEGLKPIICVGETLEQRERGVTTQVVTEQMKGVLAGLTADQLANVIIAYEPVWAIGTGKTATPQQANEVHQLIRVLVSELYTSLISEKLIIQYGGSVKPENAKDLLTQSDIDGALVGGACLRVDSFTAIVSAALL
ncbi:MAG: triose-phosphate isomerase [Bacteroidota bacterium]